MNRYFPKIGRSFDVDPNKQISTLNSVTGEVNYVAEDLPNEPHITPEEHEEYRMQRIIDKTLRIELGLD